MAALLFSSIGCWLLVLAITAVRQQRRAAAKADTADTADTAEREKDRASPIMAVTPRNARSINFLLPFAQGSLDSQDLRIAESSILELVETVN